MSSAADPSEYPADEQQPKEIFFKEINFSPDLTIRMDYQVICEKYPCSPIIYRLKNHVL